VAAHVQQGGNVVLLVAEQYDGLVADAAGQGCFGNLIGPGGNVPGVADEHGGFLLLLLVLLLLLYISGERPPPRGFPQAGGQAGVAGSKSTRHAGCRCAPTTVSARLRRVSCERSTTALAAGAGRPASTTLLRCNKSKSWMPAPGLT
jgi:hypothetical protein